MTQKVLLTGASGYFGAHVLNVLLKAGYYVRATVRTQKKADQVADIFSQYKSHLELVIVEDVAIPNILDSFVKDVTGIFHTASPCSYRTKDVKAELLDPSINGTLSVLNSAYNSESVRRVVLTSSISAVAELTNPKIRYVYTEKDFSTYSYEDTVKANNPVQGYFASKVLSEKAAWDFIETKKPSFDITVLNPPYLFGPFIHHINTLDDLNESLKILYEFTTKTTEEMLAKTKSAFGVDVRDAAEALLLSFESTMASNQRYLSVSYTFDFQQLADLIHKNFPGQTNTPVGTPGKHYYHLLFDSSKIKNDLDITFRSIEESIADTVTQFLSWKSSS